MKCFFRLIKNFLIVFVPLIVLVISFLVRPNIVISIDKDFSHTRYISTELKNIGNAPAFDLKYDIFQPEVNNPQKPLFEKDIFMVGRIYQCGVQVPKIPEDNAVAYEISYKYSVINIPLIKKWQLVAKIKGLFYWTNKKWDVR
ncbi:MAG: hypothetical protein ABH843_01670 [Candidatus Omnitrophota bacterium]